jgi:hypothetical protein
MALSRLGSSIANADTLEKIFRDVGVTVFSRTADDKEGHTPSRRGSQRYAPASYLVRKVVISIGDVVAFTAGDRCIPHSRPGPRFELGEGCSHQSAARRAGHQCVDGGGSRHQRQHPSHPRLGSKRNSARSARHRNKWRPRPEPRAPAKPDKIAVAYKTHAHRAGVLTRHYCDETAKSFFLAVEYFRCQNWPEPTGGSVAPPVSPKADVVINRNGATKKRRRRPVF